MFIVRDHVVEAHGHYGWIRDIAKSYQAKYRLARKVVRDDRPALVDFRKDPLGVPPILDQLALSACTANSVAGTIRYLQMKEKLTRIFTPSRLAIYYWERARDGQTDNDAGATIEDQMAVVKTIGAPDEALWPYDVDQLTVEPPASVLAAAATDIVPQELLIVDGIDGIMDSLEQRRPVSLGFVVYSSFESTEVAITGMVPMPVLKSWRKLRLFGLDTVSGGHAVWACGYDQVRKLLICCNSWGTHWGDAGFFYLPFDYVADGNLSGPYYSVQLVRQS